MVLLSIIVFHSLQFLLYPYKTDGDILHGDADDGTYLVVRKPLKPQHDDGAVKGFQPVYPVVEHLYLT